MLNSKAMFFYLSSYYDAEKTDRYIANFAKKNKSSIKQNQFLKIYCFSFVGLIGSVGLSNLQFVDLNSGRNLFILGASLMAGLAISDWTNSHKDHIQTGIRFLKIFKFFTPERFL